MNDVPVCENAELGFGHREDAAETVHPVARKSPYGRGGAYSFVSAALTLIVAAGLSYALRERARLTPAAAPA